MRDLQGSSRKRTVSRARQMAMYLLRQHTSLSLDKIGQRFGGKNHTTVLYAVRCISKELDNDLETARKLAKARRLLGAWSDER